MNSNPTQLDPQIVNLTKAIRQTESGGNFQAVGKSGEYGAYQFTEPTWASSSKKYLGQNIPLTQATPQQQNEVAYKQIAEWKAKGYNVGQIASMWNAGAGKPNAYIEGNTGTNKYGVKYDTTTYAKQVATAYQQFKQGSRQVSQETQPQTNNTDLLDKVGGIVNTVFPGGQVGNLIGSLATKAAIATGIIPTPQVDYNKLTPESIAKLQAEGVPTTRQGQINENINRVSTPTPLQVGGDIAQAGLMIATPGAGEGANLATRLASQAALGAGFGLTGSLAQGNTNVGKIASDTTQGAIVGGALGAGGELLGGVLGKIAQPFKNNVQEDIINSAQRLGVQGEELPTSAITNSKTVKYMESLFNGQKLSEQVDNAQIKLNQIAQDTITKLGVSEDLTTAGQKVAQGLKEFQKTFDAETTKLYDAFSKKGGDLPMKSFNAIDTLNNILDEKEAIGELKDATYFKNKLDVLTGSGEFKQPTFDTLKNIRTAIGQKIKGGFNDPYVSQNIGQFKQLYSALSKDMEDTVKSTGNPKLVMALQKAQDQYKTGLVLFNTEYAKTIRRFANNGQFDKIIPAITSNSKSLAQLPQMLQVIGQENIPRLQSAILNDIFTKAVGTGETFTEKGIAKMITRYGEDRLKMILSPEQFGFIKDLDIVSKALAQADKLSKGSQTAFLEKSIAKVYLSASAIKDMFIGNIGGALTKITPLLGGRATELFLNSAIGRKILTTGIKIGTTKAIIRQATKIATTQITK